jgi:hypothetical protein
VSLRPGDVVTCSSCGRSATAYTTGDPARWREGEALMVSWAGYRHQATAARPVRCLFCEDAAVGRAPWEREPPTRRAEILDALCLAGCRTDGFSLSMDVDVEEAFQRWVAAGRPALALVEARPAPGEAATAGSAPPPAASPPPAAPRPVAQLGLFGGAA